MNLSKNQPAFSAYQLADVKEMTYSSWFIEEVQGLINKPNCSELIKGCINNFRDKLMKTRGSSKLFRKEALISINRDVKFRENDYLTVSNYLKSGKKPIDIGKSNIDTPTGEYSSSVDYFFRTPKEPDEIPGAWRIGES